MLTPRDYQQEAHDAAVEWMRRSTAPCLIEAATGAGKSIIVAMLAHTIHKRSGKKVLCLQPSGELTEQNREKYLATGEPCSILSASAGGKSARHPVIFGTPLTVKNHMKALCGKVALVCVDEAHETTPTIRKIIEDLREYNPFLRVVGMTATPYVLGKGYIYAEDEKGRMVESAKDPYYAKLIYKITAPFLISRGYLSPPLIGSPDSESYDTSGLVMDKKGQFTAESVDRAYHGKGRKTSAIVADVIEKSRYRRGVMFFAATRQHAAEVMESLPPEISGIITGDTKKAERRRIIKAFKEQKIKYLVNVGVLTRGFDAPHVDVVAILRRTESISLLQQIIGRGYRLFEGKENCLILDYAGNIEAHCPDGDVFAPLVKVSIGGGDTIPLDVECPECSTVNVFSARKNEEGYGYDPQGYFLDLAGERVPTDYGDMPSHYGRRCKGMTYSAKYPAGLQCAFRWTFKECPECKAENDIAARYCIQCRGEIVDPNEKLIKEFKKLKRNPYEMQVDVVLACNPIETVSRAGNPCLRVEFTTEYRNFTVWFKKGSRQERMFLDAGEIRTVTYQKEDSGFYRVWAYNQEEQVCEAV